MSTQSNGGGEYTPPRITSAAQAASFALTEYIMHIRTTRCDCGVISRWSEINEVWTSSTGTSRTLKPHKDRTPLREHAPIGVSRLPERECQVCWSCVDVLNKTRKVVDHGTDAEWRKTLAKKREEALRAAKTPPKSEKELAPATSLDLL